MSSHLFVSLTQLLAQAAPLGEPAHEPLWRLILRDFPRDASALIMYALLAASVVLVWWGNRNSGKSRSKSAFEVEDRYSTDDVRSGQTHADRPDGHRTPPRRRRGKRVA